MNELQSKINAAEARINQLKNSELFTEADRKKRLPELESELEKLFMEKAEQLMGIEVKEHIGLSSEEAKEMAESLNVTTKTLGDNI